MLDSISTTGPCCGASIDSDINDRVTEYNNLPLFSITAPVLNIPHLTNTDVDRHMPTDQNFGYYTIHDFHSNSDIVECSTNHKAFSALHCNIRSLSANFDNFNHMLSELNYSFSLIGLTETKLRVNIEMLINAKMPGYSYISIPSLSNAGGVAFYVKDDLQFISRPEFSISTLDFEALWIEINVIGQANLICGVIYRHPQSNFDKFMEYINCTIEAIHQEGKLCLFMGDFNIDLFQPQILQPTRITSHSATLIDNIFLNSIEHYLISGNLIYDLTDHLPNFIILNKFSDLPPNIKL